MKKILVSFTSIFMGAILAMNASPAYAITNPLYVDSGDEVAQSTVELVVPRSAGSSSYVSCTGAVIAPEWIITTAHCFRNPDDYIGGGKVELGDRAKHIIELEKDDEENANIDFNDPSVSIVKEDEHSRVFTQEFILPGVIAKIGNNLNNAASIPVIEAFTAPDNEDMILLKTVAEMRVKPINLKERNSIFDRFMNNSVRIYGWSTVSTDNPNLRYLNGTMEVREDRVITKSDNGSYTEQGDSGGPIVNNNNELVAIHSGRLIPTNESTGIPIADNINWIKNTINNN